MTQALQLEALKANSKNVELHPAWHDVLDATDASLLLENQGPLTYLYRQDVQENDLYWVSFVNQVGKVCHKPFTYNKTVQKWLYLNNNGIVPPESKLFDCLSDMIHFNALRCSPKESNPLVS